MGIMEVIRRHCADVDVCRVAVLTRETGDVSAELADALAQSREIRCGRSLRTTPQSNGFGRVSGIGDCRLNKRRRCATPYRGRSGDFLSPMR